MNPIFIIGQILGVIAMIISALSYQMSEPKRLIAVQTVGTSLMVIHYLMIGATLGAVLNFVCVIRNVAFYFKDKNLLLKKFSPMLFAVTLVVLGILSWENVFSILMISAIAANTIFLSFDNNQRLRKSILVTSSCVLIYNITSLSIGGAISEILAIVSSAVGLVRFKNEKKSIAPKKP